MCPWSGGTGKRCIRHLRPHQTWQFMRDWRPSWRTSLTSTRTCSEPLGTRLWPWTPNSACSSNKWLTRCMTRRAALSKKFQNPPVRVPSAHARPLQSQSSSLCVNVTCITAADPVRTVRSKTNAQGRSALTFNASSFCIMVTCALCQCLLTPCPSTLEHGRLVEAKACACVRLQYPLASVAFSPPPQNVLLLKFKLHRTENKTCYSVLKILLNVWNAPSHFFYSLSGRSGKTEE